SNVTKGTTENKQCAIQELTDSADHQLADLTRKYDALKQELLSRALRDIRTADLETLAGELRQRIESLASPFGVPAPPRRDGSVPESEIKYPVSGIQDPNGIQHPASGLEEPRTLPNLIEPEKNISTT